MAYNIIQNFITKNRSNEGLNPTGMVVHGTDTPGATDENEQSYFNNNSVSASANAFIDWDSITETVPDNEVSWGSGYTSNHKFLQVELCQPATHDVAKFTEVWNRAVWYFAYKLINKIKVTTVTKDNVLSHAEVSALYKETDHTDPVAYFAEYGKTVDDFRAAVQASINSMVNPSPTPTPTPTPAPVNQTVLILQKSLNTLKIDRLVEDGISGPATTNAVKAFQVIAGLSADGIAGPQTMSAINAILAKPICGTSYTTPIPTRYIQWRLLLVVDGIFGKSTSKAVQQWQAKNGLTADGIVGPMTWGSFLK